MEKTEPRVVIVGAGFGGIKAAQALRRAPVELTLIDRNNHHLFQPLLYQVAAAYLDPEQIAKLVRGIFRGQKNLSFKMTEMTGVDFRNRVLETTSGALPYDYLILAMGGRTNFLGMPGVQEHGYALKRLTDAVGIRNRLLRGFERAALEPEEGPRRAALTAVVGGGGAAGVEMAGALAELTANVLSRDFKEFRSEDFRIILCEAAEVTGKLGVPLASGGRIVVEPTLQLPGHPEVFAIGDAAFWKEGGQAIPMVAPAAQIGGLKFRGFTAWLVWLTVHLIRLVGFRNRLVVLINWAWDYLFLERASRIIIDR
jgi:NADH dehydrogenase FAD-containing subunit